MHLRVSDLRAPHRRRSHARGCGVVEAGADPSGLSHFTSVFGFFVATIFLQPGCATAPPTHDIYDVR